MNKTSLSTLREAEATLAEREVTPFVLPLGDAAPVVAGALEGLSRGDWWVPGFRERAGAVLRQVPIARLDHSHRGAKPYKVAPTFSSGALRALYAVGLAAAEKGAVLVHLGTGNMAEGAFYEALNLAALQGRRVIFLLTTRSLEGAPVPTQSATSAEALARSLNIGYDLIASPQIEAVREAVSAAREADGPRVLEVFMTPSNTSPESTASQ